MNNLSTNLLNDLERLVNEFMSSFDLSNRSAEEIEKIKLFAEDALSDRVSLFVLRNLRGKQLEQYEEMIEAEDVDPLKINKFLEENIFDYKNRLIQDLQELQQEVLEKINNK
jgi:hypothetical protein